MAGAQRFLYDIAFIAVRNMGIFMLWCGGVGKCGTLCTGRADVSNHVPRHITIIFMLNYP
jgi:predicted MFS family arabinose efflux permease